MPIQGSIGYGEVVITGKERITMTPEEEQQLKFYLRSAAKILKANTPKAELQDFESIELAARQHILETVGPTMAEVFLPRGDREQRKAVLDRLKSLEDKPRNGDWDLGLNSVH